MNTATVKKKSVGKIVWDIIEWIIIGIFAVFLILVIIFASHAPGSNSSGSLFGFETRLVLTSSMDADDSFYEGKDYKIKNIAPGSLVFLKDCDYENETKKEKFYSELEEGDIITYFSNITNVYVTHRIIGVTESGTDILYSVNGDNVDADTSIKETISKSSNLIVGKVVYKSYALGWLYVNFVSNKVAMWCVIALPCFILAVYEGIKIVMIVSQDKKEKQEAEKNKQNEEISSLQKQIEELKKQQAQSEEEKKDE